MNITAFYFSGTGNTLWAGQHLQEKFHQKGHSFELISIEAFKDSGADESRLGELLAAADLLGIFYPIYGSNMPQIMSDFLEGLKSFEVKSGARAFTISTVAIFSGDGALMAEPFFKKMGLDFFGAWNIFLPCNFDTPVPGFKIPPPQQVDRMKEAAIIKLDKIAGDLEKGVVTLEGCGFFDRIGGGMQRLAEGAMASYNVRINNALCIRCGLCVKICPTDNLCFENGGDDETKVLTTQGRCTICMRCINHCPVYAIRLLSKKGTKPYKQYKGPDGKLDFEVLKK